MAGDEPNWARASYEDCIKAVLGEDTSEGGLSMDGIQRGVSVKRGDCTTPSIVNDETWVLYGAGELEKVTFGGFKLKCRKRARASSASAASTPELVASPRSVLPWQLAVHISEVKTWTKAKHPCVQCSTPTYHGCGLCGVSMCKLRFNKACCLEYHMVGNGKRCVMEETNEALD